MKAYIENPGEFLVNDSSLELKQQYSDQMQFKPNKNLFVGKVYVFTNGGMFSAATNFVRLPYNRRIQSPERVIRFIGEENGGDIYSQVQCAGQSYIIELPNSKIKVDMPAICMGELNRVSPEQRLPDFEVFQIAKGLANGKDEVLKFTIQNMKRISAPQVHPSKTRK